MVKRDLITNTLLLILTVLVLVCLRVFLFEPHTVTAEQANTYLQTDDYLVAAKLAKPDYKDFVLYEVDGKEYMGRVIAKEEDNPVYMDDIFYLNNQVESQSYLDGLRGAHSDAQPVDNPFTADFTLSSLTGTAMTAIPKEQYLILNDNRQNLQDSRTFGLIKRSQIRGVVKFRVLPLNQFGFLDVE